MRIQLLKPVVVKGRPGVGVGDVIEVDAHTAHDLTSSGCAMDYTLTPEPVASQVLTREPVIENREPVIQPTVRRKKTLP